MEQPPLKRICSETPTGSKNDYSSAQSDENPVDSSIYLTYDILRIVFRSLNGRDLTNAAKVCRLWLEAANSEKCTRRCPEHFIQYYKSSVDLENIKDSKIRPSVGFFFISRFTSPKIEECILNSLPQNCMAIMLYTNGTIINNIEKECEDSHVICALLPQISDVKINAFKVTKKCMLPILQSERLSQAIKYQEFIKMIDETSVQNCNKSTCLMLLCNEAGYATAMCLAATIKNSQDGITSLWGGVVENIHTQYSNIPYTKKGEDISYNPRNPYCLAVLITGPIQTWSTIVDKKCKTKEQIEVRLRLFRDQVKLKKHSMGFMFACKARAAIIHNENVYQIHNEEAMIFKTLFPEVPLVGCFGDGEFGKNTTHAEEMQKETRSKKKQKVYKELYNEFSIMFLILTYG
ncbi:F-box only protein 22-like [Nylanderia fulva]|uniref:F-box only protein 22-like n=1 Tax=Nylanderia fulva TaxID=613905 RepID=UPI0010FB2D4C|nr:F-box only protein 22-like [Nylanderia fulva]